MKVMFVVHRMHPNLLGVHNALVSMGHHCVFVVAGVGPSEPEVFEDRIVATPEILSRAKAEEILGSVTPDLVIQRNVEAPFLHFWKIARERGIPIALYTQDPHEVPLADFFVRPLRVIRLFRDLLKQRIILGPHVRITPVRFWGKEGRLSFPSSVYLPFPTVTKNLVRPSAGKPLTVLTVAKHGQARKRVKWALKALKQASSPFTLIIAGVRPSPADRRRRKNYSFFLQSIDNLRERAHHVIVHENLNREEMEVLYSNSDVFVLPSKREPMAISPLEALSHGLPVLVGSDGGATSYIYPVGKQQIFRTRSYRDFRKKLFQILEDEKLRKMLSEQALTYLEHSHSPKGFVSQLVTLSRLEAGKFGSQ